MTTLRVEIHDSEAPCDALARVAAQLLEDLNASHGGLIVVPGPDHIGTDVLFTCIERELQDTGNQPLTAWADTVEHEIPYGFIEQLVMRAGEGAPALDIESLREHPATAPAAVTDWLTALPAGDDSPLPCLGLGDAQWIDAESAAALRYAIPRAIHRGVIVVVSVSGGGSRIFPDFLCQFAAHEPQGRLVLLPTLTPPQAQRHFAERFGFTLGGDSAHFLINETAGLIGAVNDVFDEITPSDLESIRTTRQIPGDVFTRLSAFSPPPPADRDPRFAVFEEICAVGGAPVPRDSFIRLAQRLGVLDLVQRAIHESEIVQLPATGDFCLRAPSQRLHIFERSGRDRLRSVHAAFAAEKVGNAAAHRVLAAEAIDESVLARTFKDARALEHDGRPRDASVVLRAADLSADDAAVALQLLCEGLRVHIRHLLRFQSDDFLPRLRALEDQVEVHYLTLWSNYLSPFGAHDSHRERLEFAEAPSTTEAHRWMRLDIASLDAFDAFTGGAFEQFAASATRARQLLNEVQPAPPRGMWWVSRDGRLLSLEAFELAVDASRGLHSAEELIARAAELAAHARDVTTSERDIFDAFAVCAQIEFRYGSLSRCRDYLDEATRHASSNVGGPFFASTVVQLRALTLIYFGQWDEAKQLLDGEMEKIFEAPDPQVRRTIPQIASYVATIQGDFDAAEELLEIARRERTHTQNTLALEDFIVLVEGEFAMHTGGFTQVLAALKPYGEGTYFGAELWRAVAYSFLEQPEQATRAFERCRELQHPPFDELSSFLDHAEGVVLLARGDIDGAATALRRGIASALCPLERAKCELALARILGDEPEAHALVQSAVAGLKSVGATAYLRRVESSLTQMANTRFDRVKRLTARERQIAELAAKGWTNPEIARELGISRSTTAFHLSRVFEKLEISNRREIARAMSSPTSTSPMPLTS